MSNYYCETSCALPFPPEKLPQVREIVAREIKRLEEGEAGSCGVDVDVEAEANHVWFHSDMSCDVEHIEVIARALIEELQLDTPFICTWSFTCDKPRIDEFGGGGFAIVRGKPTYWVNPLQLLNAWVQEITK